MSGGRPSPRSASEPMAFTSDELMRGAGCSWLLFTVSTTAWTAVWTLIVTGHIAGGEDVLQAILRFFLAALFALMIGGAVSLLVMALGLPLARLLAWTLRREGRVWIHVLAFSGLGVALGIGAALLLMTMSLFSLLPLLAAPVPVFAAIAVPLGWWFSARRALDEDRGAAPHRERSRCLARVLSPGHDPDAGFEDRATDRGAARA